ncbi:MAG: LptA/OstA family protein [bacterium]|jgi:lipopolysaccharide export system protein LptA|nr:LptA/OstA family protein [bacterium]
MVLRSLLGFLYVSLLLGFCPVGAATMEADRIDYQTDTGLFKAAGSVKITENGYKITGREALFCSKGKSRRITVTGNPILTGEGITLASKKMEIEKQVFTASGDVRLQREDMKAACELAVYKIASKEITLSGAARARQADKSISADKIIFTSKLIMAEGNARLEMPLEDADKNG